MTDSKNGGLKTVTVYKPHTHDGKRLRPGPEGIEIQVGNQDAKFLKDAGVLDKPEAITEAGATRPGTPLAVGGVVGGTRPQG